MLDHKQTMSKQSSSAADLDAALVNHPDTAPPTYTSSSTSATTAPPCASSSTKMDPEEDAAQFVARMCLFNGEGKNPDILSFIIISNLVAASPGTKKLPLSNAKIATLSLRNNSFTELVKISIMKHDEGRAQDWDKLSPDFMRLLFQYIVLHQDTEGNSYKAWIPVCRDVRPSFRAYGKNPIYAITIGSLKRFRDDDKLEKLRGKDNNGAKGYGDFMAIWLLFLGTVEQQENEKERAEEYAAYQKLGERLE